MGLYSSSRRSASRLDPPPSGPPYTSSKWDYYERTPSGPVLKSEFAKRSGNPDPNNYNVLDVQECNGYLIVELEYLDCTNFEGRKLLVFDKGVTAAKLMMQRSIDPHFGVNPKFVHPIARFEPTDKGKKHAQAFCEAA